MDINKYKTFIDGCEACKQDIDTVRALHQTVIALRKELEKSKSLQRGSGNTCDLELQFCKQALEKMSVENKLLKEQLTADREKLSLSEGESVSVKDASSQCRNNVTFADEEEPEKSLSQQGSVDTADDQQTSESDLEYTLKIAEVQDEAELTAGEEGDDESTTVDDIELIFTTDDTKELPSCMETLVSISDAEGEEEEDEDKENKDGGRPVLLKYQQVRFDTPKEEEKNGKKEVKFKGNGFLPHQDTLAVTRTTLQKKVGLSKKKSLKFSEEEEEEEEEEDSDDHPIRPILTSSNLPKKESGAQTLITAIPKQWKSENYLAHKFSSSSSSVFSTLPSKFSLPCSHAFQRNRQPQIMATAASSAAAAKAVATSSSSSKPRALLSDLNFTSMVPEFTRSADRLNGQRDDGVDGGGEGHHQGLHQGIRHHQGHVQSQLRGRRGTQEGEYYHMREGASGMQRWHQTYVQDYPSTSSTSRHRPNHHFWPSSVPSSPEQSQDGWSKGGRSPGIFWGASSSAGGVQPTPPPLRRSWSSLPASPQHLIVEQMGGRSYYKGYGGGREGGRGRVGGKQRKKPAKVFFKDVIRHSGSLPNLWTMDGDSGGSTDSLIDEAEEFVRSSIDMLLTHEDWETIVRRRKLRRRSEPDFVRGIPIPLSRPFLPKASTDLKLYDYVKVIHVGGRVGVGRVRYSGTLPGKLEPYVGVELETSTGDCDGHFEGNRYFECDPGRGVFVPFKKVILAWAVR